MTFFFVDDGFESASVAPDLFSDGLKGRHVPNRGRRESMLAPGRRGGGRRGGIGRTRRHTSRRSRTPSPFYAELDGECATQQCGIFDAADASYPFAVS